MEWRIVVPVLCLIAFTGAGVNATSNNATNITTSAPPPAPATVTNQTANNNQTANTNQTVNTNQTTTTAATTATNQTANNNQTANTNQTVNTNQTTTTAATTATNQTANNNQTTTTAATTVSTPAKLATVNVVFRILQDFKDIYSNLSDPETIKLTENITNGFTPIYKKRFPNFLRMRIRKFSRGSIVADSVFEFDNTNNTSPNVTEVTNTFTEAVKTGNLSFPVDATSINATDITNSETNVTATANTSTTTQAATTSVSIEGFNLTFKMTGDFTDDLSNMSSSAAINLTNTVIDQLDKVFKKIASHRRTFVRQFRKGSIDVDAGLEFNKVSSPTAENLAKALADGVRNGVVALPIDPKTIKVTDSTGTTASKSPVLASMLTAFWMTLASLLLSAVMH